MDHPAAPYTIIRYDYFVGGHMCTNRFFYPFSAGVAAPETAEVAAYQNMFPWGMLFIQLLSHDVTLTTVRAELNDGTNTAFGTWVNDPPIPGGQMGGSLPAKDVCVLQKHVRGGSYYGGPTGTHQVLFHSYISGLDETRVKVGTIDEDYRQQLEEWGNFVRLAYGNEVLWSPKLNTYLHPSQTTALPLIKVLRRRSRPSS